MTNVLITGGAGFIGSNLARMFQERGGYSVTVLDNLSPQIHGEKASFNPALEVITRCIRGDVTQMEDCLAALEGQEVVIHLAAETGTGQSMYEIRRYCSANVMGTATLLEACKSMKGSIRKIILASSRAVYGEGKHLCRECGPVYPGPRDESKMCRGDFGVYCPRCLRATLAAPTDEKTPAMPLSVYGASKLMQEHLLRLYAASYGNPCVSLRFQNVYGPGQSLRNPYTGILSIFSTRIMNGNPVEIYEDGKESRDFVHVTDAAAAILLALERETGLYDCFNIGTGSATSVDEVVTLLCEAFGTQESRIREGKFRVGDIRHNMADIHHAKELLGFQPQRNFREGAREFASWVMACSPAKDLYGASVKEIEKENLIKGGTLSGGGRLP
jgi:dTDP-L-rhamnose 4-epimerase